MDRVEPESFGLFCPELADELVRCEAFERLQSPGEIVGRHKVGEMRSKLIVRFVEIAFDGRVLECPVHAFGLPVRPWMPDFGEAVFYSVFPATHVEHVRHASRRWAARVAGRNCELDAVAGQNGMDRAGNGCDQRHQKGRCGFSAGLGDQLNESEFACAINGDVEVELAFGGLNLGNIEMKSADRAGLELLPAGLVTIHIRQPGDAVALAASDAGMTASNAGS